MGGKLDGRAGSLPSRIIISYLACTYRPAGPSYDNAMGYPISYPIRPNSLHLPLCTSMDLPRVTRSVFICSTIPRRTRAYATRSVSFSNTGGSTGVVNSLDTTSGVLSYFTTSLVQDAVVRTSNSNPATFPLVLSNGFIGGFLGGNLGFITQG